MATNLTRIKNNQITDATINAAAKIESYTVTGGLLANNITYGSDLTVSGNLTINGTTTTIDTTNTVIEDPVIALAWTQTGTPVVDIGFLGERGDQDNIAFVWNEANTEFVTAFTTTLETNTTISIIGYANFHTNDANIGGNLVINGTTSFVGNITSDISVDGNITGANVYSPGLISVTGNVTAGGGFSTPSDISAQGNVTGGNIFTSGAVSATGDVTGGNIYFGTGEVSGTGNIYANSIFANISGNIDAAGNTYEVQFNGPGDILTADAGMTYDPTSGNKPAPTTKSNRNSPSPISVSSRTQNAIACIMKDRV